jgi:NAD+ synthase (glutamine-hydrolysing)
LFKPLPAVGFSQAPLLKSLEPAPVAARRVKGSVTIPFMKKTLRLAMAQINVVVGDIAGNAKKIAAWMDRAVELQADVVTFPELALTGYPPEDLLLKPQFIEANLAAMEDLARHARDITAIVGFVDRKDDIFNAAAVVQGGKVAATYH